MATLGAFCSDAQACIVAPPDLQKETQNLAEFVRQTLRVDKNEITSVTVENASAERLWLESESTMCPDALTTKATIIMEYTDNLTGVQCISTVESSKLTKSRVQYGKKGIESKSVESKYDASSIDTTCEM